MELKFVISKEALFTTALLKSTEIEGWVDLQNELWDKYKLGYELLQGNATNIFADENSQDTLNKATQEVKLLIEDGMKSDKFTLLLKNAEGYKSWLENEWSSNKQNVEKELSDILKVDLPKDVFTVYVMGDLVRVGRHLGKNKIAWGHKEDWPNYSLVYLAHECLHSMFSYSDLEHALIELITDNELRIRLNKSGEYFYIDKKLVGHEYLFELEKKLLPDWQKYLDQHDQTIFDFLEALKKIHIDS